ncbi:5677_t:CDS:2 [Diversispora eburnea]|uniref:Ammonium transporter n=2 Tax=Diversisporales TaxID=214509 RepID=A0A9N8UZM3_9GLOM|nr:5677_t:CDS:2 [Diversispora eburnea]CAG8763160.1 11627_t:CDS:2 [Dentiscutata erythropus]
MSNDTSSTPEIPETASSGDVAWVLASTALVWVMIPGVGYFYSGMARSKNALSLIFLSFVSAAVVSFQWWLWGFSLTFGPSPNKFIGNLDYAFFRNVNNLPSNDDTNGQKITASSTLPVIAFALYQCMFAAITPALAIGAAAERGRILPTIVFIFIWTTIVYDVIACWTWNVNGWSSVLGGLDFAGGTPVHIASGAAALAYSLALGKRNGHGTEEFKPHNISNTAIGTALLWFGWFGFNGGSELAANGRAALACVVTNLAASVGGITWCLVDFRLERKLSVIGFCSGAVSGLVAITPGSGFVGAPAAVVFGICAGIFCNLAVKLKHLLDFDDALDVFAVHCVGGFVGNILTGVFAQKSVISADGTDLPGGWIEGNWIQVPYQLAGSVAGIAYSFVITYLLLIIMNKIPGLSIRSTEEDETAGLDISEIGELAYHHIEKLITANNDDDKNKENVHKIDSNV